jgi:hypothetical protein
MALPNVVDDGAACPLRLTGSGTGAERIRRRHQRRRGERRWRAHASAQSRPRRADGIHWPRPAHRVCDVHVRGLPRWVAAVELTRGRHTDSAFRAELIGIGRRPPRVTTLGRAAGASRYIERGAPESRDRITAGHGVDLAHIGMDVSADGGAARHATPLGHARLGAFYAASRIAGDGRASRRTARVPPIETTSGGASTTLGTHEDTPSRRQQNRLS